MVALSGTVSPPLPAALPRARRPVVVLLALTLLAAPVVLLLRAQQRQQLPLQLARSVTAKLPHGSDLLHAVKALGSSGLPDGGQAGTGSASASGASGSTGGASSASAIPPPRNCSLQLEPSPFVDSCRLLRDVCVDQGTVILYSSKDARRLQKGGPGLELIQPPDNRLRFSFEYRAGGRRTRRYTSPAIRMRPASSLEGAAYLQGEPLFSSCTVPIVWYPFERLHNFAHLFRDNAADIFSGLQDSPGWSAAAKLVVMTAEGLAMPRWNLDILQPLSQLRVETWADFSARLPAAEVVNGNGSSSFVPAGHTADSEDVPELSVEGGPQRCFRHMFVCTEGLTGGGWPLHGLGQHLVQHHGRSGGEKATAAAGGSSAAAKQGSQAAAAGDSSAAAKQGSQAAAAGGSSAAAKHGSQAAAAGDSSAAAKQGSQAAAAGGSGAQGLRRRGRRQPGAAQVLRILFHRRGTSDRQLLNAKELLQACNTWRYNSSGVQLRASCAEVDLPSLEAGMAAAQEADVFVGMHGANMANAWLLRPGSSMIELQAFGFDGSPAHLQYPLANAKDKDSRVLWWVISACHPRFSTPGRHEARGTGKKSSWAKNRNLRLGWPALAHVLESIVEVNGDMADYWKRWEEGRWWWWMDGSGGLTPVGPGVFTQLRCPASAGATPA